ncbi:uncharacterized protein Bfra_009896 [Botrytis fragariae]|uniref:Uncharacterized protein n=1 Tax=Botrytis fragariae TaxID=1964551 RepID=A0A8H6ANC1_9HELO|nr:uncharacterized protein Bfra_009896 [Botrytis fragariae]KAF5870508.1 hypothetical protein Bfra_009896 [Botrytis fragariae]
MAPSNNQSQSVESATTLLYNFSLAGITRSNDKYQQRISTTSLPTKLNGAAKNKHSTPTSNLVDSPTIKEAREEVFEGRGTMEKAPMTLFRRRRNYRSQVKNESEAGFEYGDSMSKGQNSKHINPRTVQFMLRREQGLRRLLTLSDDQTSHAEILAEIVARDTAKADVLNKTNTGSK